jgi:hypothetical protein
LHGLIFNLSVLYWQDQPDTLRYYKPVRPTLLSMSGVLSDKKWGLSSPLPKQQRSLLEGFGGFSFPVPTLGFEVAPCKLTYLQTG